MAVDASSTPVTRPPSLYECGQKALLEAPVQIAALLQAGAIPTRIHRELFSAAALLCRNDGVRIKSAVVILVALWPQTSFCLTDLLPEQQVNSLVHSGGEHSLLDMIIEGLVSARPTSKLKVVDFSGLCSSDVFQLPVLSLSPQGRMSKEVIDSILKSCNSFTDDQEELESVITWKLSELSKLQFGGNFQGQRPIDIYVESKLNLTDWMAMVNEIIGLCLQRDSPFRFKLKKLAIDNFYFKNTAHLKWVMNTTDLESLTDLFIYGNKRSIRLVMWAFGDTINNLPSLRVFGMGNSGLRIDSNLLSPSDPTDDEVLESGALILGHWNQLQELQLIGLYLSAKLERWLEPLRVPLKKVSFYACRLAKEDLEYLTRSHHTPSIEIFAMEKNVFRGLGEVLCSVVRQARSLELLNLRETCLQLFEKISVLETLIETGARIETLALYEQEDMVSTSGYETLIELACAIPTLDHFYVFPFNYKPFELFYREQVELACEEILKINGRVDLQLFY